MEPIKAIIVDDEPPSRRVLEGYLDEYCSNVKVTAAVGNVAEAVDAIKKLRPNLVFLDIEMPGDDGFQLLNYFDSSSLSTKPNASTNSAAITPNKSPPYVPI